MLHEAVNQKYDRKFPYGFHLSMVADFAMEYGHEVVSSEEDIIPVVFGAYFHDSIEDARLTYNDVRKEAEAFMDTRQALAPKSFMRLPTTKAEPVMNVRERIIMPAYAKRLMLLLSSCATGWPT